MLQITVWFNAGTVRLQPGKKSVRTFQTSDGEVTVNQLFYENITMAGVNSLSVILKKPMFNHWDISEEDLLTVYRELWTAGLSSLLFFFEAPYFVCGCVCVLP